MQALLDLLAAAIEAIVQALILAGVLAGAVIWQMKRSGQEDPRDKLVKKLNTDIYHLTEAVQDLGQRLSYLEGRSNGQRH